MQLNFARSIDPIVPQEVTITRVAITTEADAEKKGTEMGRKHIVPYALYRAEGKKYLKPGIIWVLLMAVSRNYLMAHYPSDVLFAAIFGVASGFIAWEITKLIFRFLEEHDDNRLCALALDFDLPLPHILLRLPLSGKGKKNAPDKDGDDAAPRRDRADTGTAGRSYDGESRRERPAAARRPSGTLEKLGIRRKKGRHEL